MTDISLTQVIFENEKTIEYCQRKIQKALKEFYPVDCYVFFSRGGGIWQGTVAAHMSCGYYSAHVNVRTSSGNIHHVYYKDIIEKKNKRDL